MAQSWLIAYDIADAKRLQRSYRLLTRHALPLQNSVFLYQGSQSQIQALYQQLSHILDKKSDDLRIYKLDARSPIYAHGQTALPEGILLSGFEEKRLNKHIE